MILHNKYKTPSNSKKAKLKKLKKKINNKTRWPDAVNTVESGCYRAQNNPMIHRPWHDGNRIDTAN